MSELFANNAATTLNGSINNSVTSLIVVSATPFPSTGNFRIRIDTEIMLVTAVSGTTFTVTRAQDGTAAASHTSGSDLVHVVTRDSLAKFREETNMIGGYGSRPAAGVAGRLYFPNDSIYLGRDDGAAWSEFGPVYKITPPPSQATFTWLNQNNGTATDTANGIFVKATASAATEDFNGKEVNAPATPYTITAGWIPGFSTDDYAGLGIYFRNSGTGKIEPNQILGITGKYLWDVRRMTSPTAYDTDASQVSAYPGSPLWFRISDDGANRQHSFSYDGLNWNPYFTVGRTTYLTADKVGYFVWNISQFTCGTLFHWEVT